MAGHYILKNNCNLPIENVCCRRSADRRSQLIQGLSHIESLKETPKSSLVG